MKSMLDDAFEAAFQDDEDLSDAAKVKELKAELSRPPEPLQKYVLFTAQCAADILTFCVVCSGLWA